MPFRKSPKKYKKDTNDKQKILSPKHKINLKKRADKMRIFHKLKLSTPKIT